MFSLLVGHTSMSQGPSEMILYITYDTLLRENRDMADDHI